MTDRESLISVNDSSLDPRNKPALCATEECARRLGVCPVKVAESSQYPQEVSEAYLLDMVRALLAVRMPLHIVHCFASLSSSRLHTDMRLMAMGDGFWASFGDSTNTHLVTIDKTMLSLGKMVDVCTTVDEVFRGGCAYNGRSKLNDIMAAPPYYPWWSFAPANALMAFIYTPLFGGGVYECLVACVIAFLVGVLEFSMPKRMKREHDIVIAAFATCCTVAVDAYVTRIAVVSTIFAVIVFYLPGLGAVLGLTDFSSGYTVVGTAKFMAALMVSVNLGIGLALGAGISSSMGVAQSEWGAAPSLPLPAFVTHISVVVSTLPTMILLNAKMRHAGFYTVSALAAYYGTLLGASYLGRFSAAMGAFFCGLVANVYGRYTRNPSVELILFGILMIVPGSVALHAVFSATSSNMAASVGFLGEMVGIAVGIVTGLAVANQLLPPARFMSSNW